MTPETLRRRHLKIAELELQQAALLDTLKTANPEQIRCIQSLLVVAERALHWQRSRLAPHPDPKTLSTGRKTRKRRRQPASPEAGVQAAS